MIKKSFWVMIIAIVAGLFAAALPNDIFAGRVRSGLLATGSDITITDPDGGGGETQTPTPPNPPKPTQGTVSDVILIDSWDKFKQIGTNSIYPANGHYKLVKDIEATSSWRPNDFSGEFDGNGYIIDICLDWMDVVLSVPNEAYGGQWWYGLFAEVSNDGDGLVYIKDVCVRYRGECNVKHESSYYDLFHFGGIAGAIIGTGSVEIVNCSIEYGDCSFYPSPVLRGDDWAFGGMIGDASNSKITIQNCTVNVCGNIRFVYSGSDYVHTGYFVGWPSHVTLNNVTLANSTYEDGAWISNGWMNTGIRVEGLDARRFIIEGYGTYGEHYTTLNGATIAKVKEGGSYYWHYDSIWNQWKPYVGNYMPTLGVASGEGTAKYEDDLVGCRDVTTSGRENKNPNKTKKYNFAGTAKYEYGASFQSRIMSEIRTYANNNAPTGQRVREVKIVYDNPVHIKVNGYVVEGTTFTLYEYDAKKASASYTGNYYTDYMIMGDDNAEIIWKLEDGENPFGKQIVVSAVDMTHDYEDMNVSIKEDATGWTLSDDCLSASASSSKLSGNGGEAPFLYTVVKDEINQDIFGYTFYGWQLQSGESWKTLSSDDKTVNRNFNYIVRGVFYAKDVNVKLDLKGGTIYDASKVGNYGWTGNVGDSYASKTIKYNSEYGELLDDDSWFTKSGYKFVGWYLNTNADGEKVSGDSHVLPDPETKKLEITLYAKWEAIKYKLTLNLNGGTGAYNSATRDWTSSYDATSNITYTSSITVVDIVCQVANEITVAHKYYTPLTTSDDVVRWYTHKSNNSPIEEDWTLQYFIDNNLLRDNQLTLYVHWKTKPILVVEVVEEDEFSVTERSAGWEYDEKYKAYINTNVAYGANISNYVLGTNDYITVFKEGHDNVEWYLNPSLTIRLGSQTALTKEQAELGYDGTIRLYPKFTPIPITVTAEVVGGHGGISPSGDCIYKYDDKPTFTFRPDTGYKVAQIRITYSADKSDYDTIVAKDGEDIYTYEFAPLKKDMTIEVTFGVKTYLITLDSQQTEVSWGSLDGWTDNVNMIKKEFNYGSTISAVPTPICSGFKFAGWYTSASGGTKISFDYTVKGDGTWYAHWNAKKYKLIAHPGVNGATWSNDSGWTEAGNDMYKMVAYRGAFGTLPTLTKLGMEHTGWIDADGNEVRASTTMGIEEDGFEISATWTFTDVELLAYTSMQGVTWDDLNGWTQNGDSYATKNAMILYKDSAGNYYLDNGDDSGNWYKSDEYGNYSGEPVDPDEVKDAEIANYYCGTLPVVSKTGYKFIGWYTQHGGKGDKVDGTTNLGENITIYAHWQVIFYDLVADANGGRIAERPNTWKLNGDQTLATGSIAFNKPYGVLPTAARRGYVFNGWWTTKLDGERVTKYDKMVIGGATIYAHWIKIHTITINSNIGDDDIGGLNATQYGNDRGISQVSSIEAAAVGCFPSYMVQDNKLKIFYITGTSFELPTSPAHVGQRGYTFLGWKVYSADDGVVWTSDTTYKVGVAITSQNDATLIAEWSKNSYTIRFMNTITGLSSVVSGITYDEEYALIDGIASLFQSSEDGTYYIVKDETYKYKLVGWMTINNAWDNHNRDYPNYDWLDKYKSTGVFDGRTKLGEKDYKYDSGQWRYLVNFIQSGSKDYNYNASKIWQKSSTATGSMFGKYFRYDSSVKYLMHAGEICLYPVLTPVYTVKVHANTGVSEAEIFKNGSGYGEYYSYEMDYLKTSGYAYTLPEAQAIKVNGGKNFVDSQTYKLGVNFTDYYEPFWKLHIITHYTITHNGLIYNYDNDAPLKGWYVSASGTFTTPLMNLYGSYVSKSNNTILYNQSIAHAFAPKYSDSTEINIYPSWDYFSFNVKFYAKSEGDAYKNAYKSIKCTTQNEGLLGAVKYNEDYGIAVNALNLVGGSRPSGYTPIEAIDINGYTFAYARPYVLNDDGTSSSKISDTVMIYRTGYENPDGENRWNYYTEGADAPQYYYKIGRQYWIDIEGYYIPNLYRVDFAFNLPETRIVLNQTLMRGGFDDTLNDSYSERYYPYATCTAGNGVNATGTSITEIKYDTVDAYTSAREQIFKQSTTYYIYILQNQEFNVVDDKLQTTYDYNLLEHDKQWIDMPIWTMDYYELQYYYVHNPSVLSGASEVEFYMYKTATLEDGDIELAQQRLSQKAPVADTKTCNDGRKWRLEYCDDVRTFNMYWYRKLINLDIKSVIGGHTSPNGYVMIAETEQIAAELLDHYPTTLILYMLNGDNSYKIYHKRFTAVGIASVFDVGSLIYGGATYNGVVAINPDARLTNEQLLSNGWTVADYVPIYIGNRFTITAFDQSKDNTLDDFIGYRFVDFSATAQNNSERFDGIANKANYVGHSISYNLKIGEIPTTNNGAVNTYATFVDKEIVTINANFENIRYTIKYQVSDKNYNNENLIYQTGIYRNQNIFGTMAINGYSRTLDGNKQTVNREHYIATIKYLWVDGSLKSNMRVNLGIELLKWASLNYNSEYEELTQEQLYELLLNAEMLRKLTYGFSTIGCGGSGYGLEDVELPMIHAVCDYIPLEIKVTVVDSTTEDTVDEYILGRTSEQDMYSDHPVFTVTQGNRMYLDNTYTLEMLTKLASDPHLYYYDDGKAYALRSLNLVTAQGQSVSAFVANFDYPITSIENLNINITRALLDASLDYNQYIELEPNNRTLNFRVLVAPLLKIEFKQSTETIDPKSGERRLIVFNETAILGTEGNDLQVTMTAYQGYAGQKITLKATANGNHYSNAKLNINGEELILPLNVAVVYTIVEECEAILTFVPKTYNLNAYLQFDGGELLDIGQYASLVTADGVQILNHVSSIREVRVKKSGGPYYYQDVCEIIVEPNLSVTTFQIEVYQNDRALAVNNNKYTITVGGKEQDINIIIKVDPTPKEVIIQQSISDAADIRTQINNGEIVASNVATLVDGDSLTVYVKPNVGYKFAGTYYRNFTTTPVTSTTEGDFLKFVLINNFSNINGDSGKYRLNFNEVGINIAFVYDIIDEPGIVDNNTYIATPNKDIAPGDEVKLTKGSDPDGYRFDSFSYAKPKDTEGSIILNETFTIDSGIMEHLAEGYIHAITNADSITLTIYVNYIRQYKLNYSITPALATIRLKDADGKGLQINKYYDRGTQITLEVETTSIENYNVSAIIDMGVGESINTESVASNPEQVINPKYTMHNKLSGFTKEFELTGDCMIKITVQPDNYYTQVNEKILTASGTIDGAIMQMVDGTTAYGATGNINYVVTGDHSYGSRMNIKVYLTKPAETAIGTNYYDLTGAMLGDTNLKINKLEDETIEGVDYQVYELSYMLISVDAVPQLHLNYTAYSQVKIDIRITK